MNRTQKTTSLILSALYLISILPVSAEPLNDTDTNECLENKKFLCTATLEDDFADDSVIVVINKDRSELNNKFQISDFGEEVFNEIIDLSAVDGDLNGKEYLNSKDFRKILKLKLKKKGKEEVLNAIEALEKIEWIESAEPNN